MITKVLKFGGTSLSSRSSLENLAARVRSEREGGANILLVVSAFEGQTDAVAALAHLAAAEDPSYQLSYDELATFHHRIIDNVFGAATQDPGLSQLRTAVGSLLSDLRDVLHGISLVKDLSAKTLDFVMSFGERISSIVVTEFLRREFADAWHLDARVDLEWSMDAIRRVIREKGGLPVITGFIASTSRAETTTLGRGGSDYTAALFAAACDASEIQLWTTVDGVMTADPKKVGKAISIPQLTYEEALELGHFGAKVIFAPALQPALARNIPVLIKNSLRPEGRGTIVGKEEAESEYPITGISSIGRVALLQLQGSGLIGVAGTAKRLFDALSKAAVNVVLISQASSEHSICFAVSPDSVEGAKKAVEREFALEIRAGQVALAVPQTQHSIVAAVGSRMRNTPGISGKLFQALGKNGINVVAIAQGSSELNISVVVAKEDEKKALNALHDTFFLSGSKTIHLFLVGIGLVGSKLLEQIRSQVESYSARGLELRLVAVSNSSTMLFSPEGIDLGDWKQALASSGEKASMEQFVERIQALNLPNSIFVDCTASPLLAKHYPAILRSSISIVTPNKKANSGSLAEYRELRASAKRGNVKFFYETNVGAGLPVIGTLTDLLASGDRVVKIEAVLSGTLSYIFNSFRAGDRFSEIVREAKRRGYTEPDPRDDLSGADVARKLLILARETDLPLEVQDIEVESLVPACAAGAGSPDEFLTGLADADGEFDAKIRAAAARGEVLRYVGIVENGKGKVALRSVDANHPFYSLSGSDNIISFVTNRYLERPLVVKGPGAGTDVTAAGVLADILRVSSYLV